MSPVTPITTIAEVPITRDSALESRSSAAVGGEVREKRVTHCGGWICYVPRAPTRHIRIGCGKPVPPPGLIEKCLREIGQLPQPFTDFR